VGGFGRTPPAEVGPIARSWPRCSTSCERGTRWWCGDLDRLGRSLPHLIELISDLEARGVGFKSVQENIDTTTPGGRLVFHVFGALASFERELIQERTLAGLAAARERGRLGGRPTALSPAKLKQARKMIGEKTPVTEVAQVLGVSRATLYRRVPELGEARTRPVMNEPDAGVSSPP